jgi:hypothetical protein
MLPPHLDAILANLQQAAVIPGGGNSESHRQLVDELEWVMNELGDRQSPFGTLIVVPSPGSCPVCKKPF